MNTSYPFFLSLLLASATVMATEGAPMDNTSQPAELPSFQTLDADGSGTISKTEAEADVLLIKQWDLVDVDRSGDISKNEYAKLESGG